MNKDIWLTKAIHYFVRGKLSWDESLKLLDEILDSEEWIEFLETDILLYQLAMEKQEPETDSFRLL